MGDTYIITAHGYASPSDRYYAPDDTDSNGFQGHGMSNYSGVSGYSPGDAASEAAAECVWDTVRCHDPSNHPGSNSDLHGGPIVPPWTSYAFVSMSTWSGSCPVLTDRNNPSVAGYTGNGGYGVAIGGGSEATVQIQYPWAWISFRQAMFEWVGANSLFAVADDYEIVDFWLAYDESKDQTYGSPEYTPIKWYATTQTDSSETWGIHPDGEGWYVTSYNYGGPDLLIENGTLVVDVTAPGPTDWQRVPPSLWKPARDASEAAGDIGISMTVIGIPEIAMSHTIPVLPDPVSAWSRYRAGATLSAKFKFAPKGAASGGSGGWSVAVD